MDNDRTIICSIQVGRVEVGIWKRCYQDEDVEVDSYEVMIGDGFLPARYDIGDLPDLIRAVYKALRIVRAYYEPYAASEIDLDRLVGCLNGVPPWLSNGLQKP